MSKGLHAQAVSADHQRILYRSQLGNILIHLVFLSRNFSPTQASILFSHHQFLFSSITISRHTQLNPRPVPSFCPGHWLITRLWAKLCLTLFIKKGDSLKPTTLLKAFLFFPGAKKKCNMSTQAQGCESYMWSKSTVLALALTILPSLGQIT